MTYDKRRNILTRKTVAIDDSDRLSFLQEEGENTFYGQHLSLCQLDTEMSYLLGVKNLDGQFSQITRKAWYDYRFMHPMLRVYYFIECYEKSKDWFVKRTGLSQFEKRAATPMNRYSKASITSFIMATMLVDSLCIPYDFWCQKIMEYAVLDGQKRPFLPNNLSRKDFAILVCDAFADRNKAGVWLAKSHAFFIENHEFNIFAQEYQDYLWRCLENKENKGFYVAQLHKYVRQMSQTYAVQKMGKCDFDYAIKTY